MKQNGLISVLRGFRGDAAQIERQRDQALSAISHVRPQVRSWVKEIWPKRQYNDPIPYNAEFLLPTGQNEAATSTFLLIDIFRL
jgi:hypothetical protein